MKLYDDKILPHILNLACSTGEVMQARQQVVPLARGRVLDVGMGSGLNLALYDAQKVEWVWGLEPSAAMRHKARNNVERSPVPVKWLDLPGEQIPLDDESVDTVVLTFTLCTIPDWSLALRQMYRVLKPGGHLLFCEHGRAPDPGVRVWQDRLTPAWTKLAGGCHLNRPITDYIEQAGFRITQVERQYLAKTPRLLGYVSHGQAEKPSQQ